MKSTLLSSFGEAIEVMRNFFDRSIGTAGIAIIVCLLAVFALILFWNLCKAAIGKSKIVIKWGQLVLLIIDVVLLVYFCLMF